MIDEVWSKWQIVNPTGKLLKMSKWEIKSAKQAGKWESLKLSKSAIQSDNIRI